jgi:hypothetical protein
VDFSVAFTNQTALAFPNLALVAGDLIFAFKLPCSVRCCRRLSRRS